MAVAENFLIQESFVLIADQHLVTILLQVSSKTIVIFCFAHFYL